MVKEDDVVPQSNHAVAEVPPALIIPRNSAELDETALASPVLTPNAAEVSEIVVKVFVSDRTTLLVLDVAATARK